MKPKRLLVLAVCLIVGYGVYALLYSNGVFKQEEKYTPYTYKGIAFTLPESWIKNDSVSDHFAYGDKDSKKDKDGWMEYIEIVKSTYDQNKYLPANKQIQGVLEYFKAAKNVSNFKKTHIKVDNKERIAFTATTNDKLTYEGKKEKNADKFSDKVKRTTLLIPHKDDLYCIIISYSDSVKDEEKAKEHKDKIIKSMSFSWE